MTMLQIKNKTKTAIQNKNANNNLEKLKKINFQVAKNKN